MTTSFPIAFLDVGTPELLLIFFVVLLLFGPQRLPELAKGLGKSIREFKKATAGVEEEIRRAMNEPSTLKAQPTLPRNVEVVPAVATVISAPANATQVPGVPATDAKL